MLTLPGDLMTRERENRGDFRQRPGLIEIPSVLLDDGIAEASHHAPERRFRFLAALPRRGRAPRRCPLKDVRASRPDIRLKAVENMLPRRRLPR